MNGRQDAWPPRQPRWLSSVTRRGIKNNCNRRQTEYALRVVTTTTNTKVGVIGASGYIGEELVRLLLAHPQTDLVAVTSRRNAGKTVAEAFPRFAHRDEAHVLTFRDADPIAIAEVADVIFLALPHGASAAIAKPLLDGGARVLDLSADFRICDSAVYKEFYSNDHPAPELLGESVYGLPEVYREKIRQARLVACPGCYSTSVLLPLLPIVREQLIDLGRILVASLSGVTGAGRKVETDYLFAECNESLRPYGVPKHRHLAEIEQELSIPAKHKVIVQFTPHLVPVNRGIISTMYLDLNNGVDSGMIDSIYDRAYGKEPFVRLLGQDRLPDTKNVVDTNFIDLAWRIDQRTRRLILMSAIDNILKGASGQAIQCFNLMCGYDEVAGLI
jgi:N-acetyl-gamma-glutamyl-phosphate reductase